MYRNLFIFAVILIVIIGLAYFAFSTVQSRLNGKTAEIHGNIIILEIADEPDEQTKGLAERDSLARNRGMLFVFDKPGNYSFWMKDVRFPIDIIFLNGEKVVTIHKNVPAAVNENAGNLTLYNPKEPADRILEVNAGLTDEFNLKEGESIKLNL